MNRAVTLQGDTVVKVQPPAASRTERLRTLAGGEVGRRTGLFQVPEIVSFDDSRGTIVFQRLELTGFRRVLSGSGRSFELVGNVAQALAAIHRAMPVHGDFGVANLFYFSGAERLVIIDWANADWTGIDGSTAAPEIDLAVFLISFFHRRLFGPLPVRRRHDLARHFLRSYATASQAKPDLAVVGSTVTSLIPRFIRLTGRRKGRLYALGCRHAMIDLKFFLRGLDLKG